ncbi:MAG: hypothetical protein WBV82_32605 [Myxococcaceae bacterium]
MLLCATTVVLLASAAAEGPASDAADGPRLGAVEFSVGAGASREAYDDAPRVPYVFGGALLEVQLGPAVMLELTYDAEKREGRGPVHAAGVTGHLSTGGSLELSLSLLASPPGRSAEGNYCLPFPAGTRCVDAVERVGFFNPGLRAEYSTDPERDVVGSLGASVEATFYRLEYHFISGSLEGTLLPLPVQEYRLGLEAEVGLFDRFELGARGSYGLVPAGEQPGELSPGQLPPTELPLAPTRFDVAPTLSVRVTPGLRAQLSAEYAPYIDPCLGHSMLGSLRLTVLPGKLRIFGEVEYARDVSPTDEVTLEFCEQDEPYADYVSTGASAGFRVEF